MTNHQDHQDQQGPGDTPAETRRRVGTEFELEPDTSVAEMTNHRQGWDETEIPSQGIIRAVSNVNPQPVSDDDITAMVADAHAALQN